MERLSIPRRRRTLRAHYPGDCSSVITELPLAATISPARSQAITASDGPERTPKKELAAGSQSQMRAAE